jgi:hypothetical protein
MNVRGQPDVHGVDVGDKANPRRAWNVTSFTAVTVAWSSITISSSPSGVARRQARGPSRVARRGWQRGGARVALAADGEIAEEALGQLTGEWRWHSDSFFIYSFRCLQSGFSVMYGQENNKLFIS